MGRKANFAFAEQIRDEDLTLWSLLKTCAKKKDLREGIRLHADILSRDSLDISPHVACAIIHMYAKCGMLGKAQQMLEEIPVLDVASWNAVIACYVHRGQGREALHCFATMQQLRSLTPDAITFIYILKACGINRNIEKGKEIHAEIANRGLLRKDIMLGSALVDMYSKCGNLTKAQEAFNQLPLQNTVSWNALLSGYAQKGKPLEALECFKRMRNEGFRADTVTFTCILKACGSTGSIVDGQQIHHDIVCRGFLEDDIMLGTPLVDMYAKCDMLAEAHHILAELPVKTAAPWNALITGYAQNDQADEALSSFERMRNEGIRADVVTFTCILKACGSMRALYKGKQIHYEILSRSLLENDIILGNALVDMYAKCGMLTKALEVLEQLPVHDIVSWNAIISGYADQGKSYEAFGCFELMRIEGISPSVVTFVCVLKACGNVGAINRGIQLHDEIASKGLLEKHIVLGNVLIDMYAKCGALEMAQLVLSELSAHNVISWNALITGYIEQGKGHEALNCYQQMQSEGISPDIVTFMCLLKACASSGAIDKGIVIHNDIVKVGLLTKDIVLGNALVDMYAKCGVLSKAREVLEELPVRDTVSWNALISGYADHGQCHEALNCFEQIQTEGLSPDAVTFICMLKACGTIGAIDKGEEIHRHVLSSDMLKKDLVLGNALVDMYAKCGMLMKAQEILERLPVQNIVSWSALIAGYAQQGQGHGAVNCFKQMENKGLLPDDVTFLSIFGACSHAGLMYEAQMFFEKMMRKHEVVPRVQHYTWIIIVFGYAGHLDEAVSVIEAIPYTDSLTLWLALLGACRKWGNLKLGRLCFDQIVQNDSSCAAAYKIMGSLFAEYGMQEDAAMIDTLKQIHAG